VTRHICLYQDSPTHYVSVQLAVLSLLKFEHDILLHVYISRPTNEIIDWLSLFPNVIFHEGQAAINGFNAKPRTLLDLLLTVDDEVIWVDSDIILTGPITPILERAPKSHLILAQDPPGDWPDGSYFRTVGWGFDVGRIYPETVNSCFIRANPAHLPLINAWAAAIDSDAYQNAQKEHWSSRPAYFLGDQDALGALVGSRQFSDVQIFFLRNGRDIAQCYYANGYSWIQRLASIIFGSPTLVHAQGQKPWETRDATPTYLDVSPYKLIAREYSAQILSIDWLSQQTFSGTILCYLFSSNPSLSGLIPAFFSACRRRIKLVLNPILGRVLQGIRS
jgi:hypothetical protein